MNTLSELLHRAEVHALQLQIPIRKGGPGSGNFGHAGRPGEVGGSAPDDGGGGGMAGTSPTETETETETEEKAPREGRRESMLKEIAKVRFEGDPLPDDAEKPETTTVARDADDFDHDELWAATNAEERREYRALQRDSDIETGESLWDSTEDEREAQRNELEESGRAYDNINITDADNILEFNENAIASRVQSWLHANAETVDEPAEGETANGLTESQREGIINAVDEWRNTESAYGRSGVEQLREVLSDLPGFEHFDSQFDFDELANDLGEIEDEATSLLASDWIDEQITNVYGTRETSGTDYADSAEIDEDMRNNWLDEQRESLADRINAGEVDSGNNTVDLNVWSKDGDYRFKTTEGATVELSMGRNEGEMGRLSREAFPMTPSEQLIAMVKEPDAKVKASWITFSHSERNYSRPPPLPEDRSTWTPEQKEQAERLAREGIDIFKQVSTAVAAKVMRDKPAVISFSGADDTGKRQRTYDRLSRSLVSFFPDYIAFATGGAKGSDGRYDGKSFYLVDRTRFHVDKLFEHLASKPDIQILAKSLWFPARSFGYGFVLKSEYHRQLDEVAFDVENWMDETESVFT